jgi:hypothetical protein
VGRLDSIVSNVLVSVERSGVLDLVDDAPMSLEGIG